MNNKINEFLTSIKVEKSHNTRGRPRKYNTPEEVKEGKRINRYLKKGIPLDQIPKKQEHKGRPIKYNIPKEIRNDKNMYVRVTSRLKKGKTLEEALQQIKDGSRMKNVCKSKPTNPKLLDQYSTVINVKNNIRRKLMVLQHYGGKCVCCGENDVRFLTMDHINNNGSIDRKENGSGFGIYNKIIKQKYPGGFQILCWNCNCAKANNGYICPHRDDGMITVNNIEKLLEKKLNRMAPDWRQII